ncbi:hypothetical protein [Subtercola sp. RTI3]|uniref:hypothetical protein n=1 Tax=Subtercola sp. RTI3 TaxID=3048639 RepID=UPI002B2238EB|nr:hypothetical protein [Subtercola sp. RTI3]MEA9985946.1 hypothetical protein [Subtercola sp. RTI3]
MQSKDELPICSTQVKHTYTVTCFTPAPFTTRGEAHELQAMAAEHGWKSATVITYTPHIDRARIIVSRCFSGKLSMVEDRKPLSYAEWGYAFFYQTAGFVKVLLDQNC